VSLVTGHGPLSTVPAGWFSPTLPADVVYVEPHPRRVQAVKDGRTVIDTELALLVHRPDRPLSYAFPADEVRGLPHEPVPEAPGFVHVPWEAVDNWTELPPDEAASSRHGGRNDFGGHRRHGDRLRDRAGTPTLRRSIARSH
jgi:hypothetical protein